MNSPPEPVLVGRFGRERSTSHPVLADPVLARILNRRTHRRFRPEIVNPALLDALLDVAFSASSKSDYQQGSVIVVEDALIRKALADLVPAMPWIGTAPAFLVFCADAARLEAICGLRGHPLPNQNLEAFFNASVDAALLMQTFILAAEQVGLGCCPISVLRNHLPAVTRILALPKGVVPVAGLCLGYPADQGHISQRLPPSLTRHRDRYQRPDFSALAAYDQERALRSPTPKEKQRAPEVFGYSEFYGWSEDKARHAHAREGSEFGKLVRDHGFSLD